MALELPENKYTYLVLTDSALADGDPKSAWFTSLRSVPMPVLLSVWLFDDMCTPGWFPALEKRVKEMATNWIHSEAHKSKKCVLLQKRLSLPRPKGAPRLAAHWIAFTKLMFSDYPLAFEVLRRRTQYRPDGERVVALSLL